MAAGVEWLEGWLFIGAAALGAHFAFSWMGFNPTDDGYTLATSRRILLGEVPFRDFIIIRPPGSFLLHTVWFCFGGDSIIYISRFGAWLQFAAIAWCWVRIIERLAGLKWDTWRRVALAVVALCLSAHTFPIMVWHSVDSLFFASLGLALCAGALPGGKLPGYFLLGCAVLCRQNFAPVVLGALLVLGDWRRAGCWLAAAAPASAVAAWLWKEGALGEALGQLTAYTNLVEPGLEVYIYDFSTLAGVQAGYWAFVFLGRNALVESRVSAERASMVGAAILMLIPLLAAGGLNSEKYAREYSVFLFSSGCGVLLGSLVDWRDGWMTAWGGILAGAVLGFLYLGGFNIYIEFPAAILGAVLAWWVLVGRLPFPSGGGRWWKPGILTMLSAWCVSVSLGYSTPALMNGPVAVFLAAAAGFGLRGGAASSKTAIMRSAGVVLLAVTAAASFWIARHRIVYRDRPARELTATLNDVLAGARGIRTNPNTAAFLRDLREAVGRAGGGDYCILPDLACHWVASKGKNPLPVDWADWAHTADAGQPSMRQKVISALLEKRGGLLVIVERVRADDLGRGFVPMTDDSQFPVVRFVRTKFRLIGRTEYFDLYR